LSRDTWRAILPARVDAAGFGTRPGGADPLKRIRSRTQNVTDKLDGKLDREAVVAAIRSMGEDDLRYLNRFIVDRIKLIAQARSTVMMARFSVGDRVEFPDRGGRTRRGVVTRLNKKTVSVRTDEGERWNVGPGFLKRT
jgi:hypothetical protein